MRKKHFALFLFLSILLLFSGCATQSDLDASYDAGYRDGERHGYEDGYESGYEAGEEDALYNLQDKYPDGKLIYISNETLEDLLFLVKEHNGFDYCPEEYIIEVWDYFDAHKSGMSDDEIEAFENVITYFYDADWLTRQIVYGN